MAKLPQQQFDDNTSFQSYPEVEFHIRHALNDYHDLNLPLFAFGNGRFKIDYHQLQKMVHSLNEKDPDLHYTVSEFYGMGLLSLISHKIIRLYRNQIMPDYGTKLKSYFTERLQNEHLSDILSSFLKQLPTGLFTSSGKDLDAFIASTTDDVSHENILLEELMVHLLARINPAFTKYELTFKEDFHEIIQTPERLIKELKAWTEDLPGFGKGEKNLLDVLIEPMLASPNSIQGQLEYIRGSWGHLVGSHLRDLLRGIDFFEEENKFRGFGPGEMQLPDYSGALLDEEFYSEDSEWMPRVVMIARNALVWLDQLSKRYQRQIDHLDLIPDEELDTLASQGFTVLWLIGLWNRSSISRKIKHWCGNPDAESSAYSLKEYEVDPSIGGWPALENLRKRAWERGIRLASDMVPNHTGLDSQWLKDHPDWYIQVPEPPFPAYSFNSGDLSEDAEVSVHIEDHYYERSDAAVVFKHHDHRNGQTRYIYHGNDGTSMPWNDTAQLDYLNPELREAIIQTILHVARHFKVIRFDAAMTLAKRHIQRLWFPEPGTGGDIPSRSAHAMSGTDFQAAIPKEFWREVVDRIAQEVPDTLLLAEAFWMMEGYFVRTLGMHRVYNSAFMNMLKMEENSKFYRMVAQTLEYDSRILQRYVNFLSNPDEDTAIAQFGKGDKYFAVTTLMVTLPGLPMFAHAQVEGFEEKYGMEYRRAYWDEQIDVELVSRHEHQVFPLMKKRYLFAGAKDFRLFPVFDSDGQKIDSVFAYTNKSGTERALIIVNNAYERAAGWLKTSAPINLTPSEDQARIVTEDLIFALSFDVEDSHFVIFQEQVSRLWFIRSIADIRQHGFYTKLSGYESQIYLNFQLVSDTETNPWSEIYSVLNGAGIPDFAPMFRGIDLQPIHNLLSKLIALYADGNETPDQQKLFVLFAPLVEAILELDSIPVHLDELETLADSFQQGLADFYTTMNREPELEMSVQKNLAVLLSLSRIIRKMDKDSELSLSERLSFETTGIALFTGNEHISAHVLLASLEAIDNLLNISPASSVALFQLPAVKIALKVHTTGKQTWFKKEALSELLNIIQRVFPEVFSAKELDMLGISAENAGYRYNTFCESLTGFLDR